MKQLLLNLLQRVKQFWDETGRRWTLVLLLLGAFVVVARISARAREMLRAQIVRQPLGKTAEVPEVSLSLFQPGMSAFSTRAQTKELLRKIRLLVWQLASNQHSRPVLAISIFAHTLLAWLFVILLWTLRFG